MATGDQADVAARLRSLIPPSWFPQDAPNVNALLQGFAAVGAWAYDLIAFAYLQIRLATASGIFLDLFAYDYLGLFIRRRKEEADDNWRARIKATILQERVTRAGMASMIKTLAGGPPIIFEPWNTGDAGGWNTGALAWAGSTAGSSPGGGWNVASGWGVNASGWGLTSASSADASTGAGGWGSTTMPAQFLITVPPAVQQGVPQIGGWNQGPISWNGAGEWTGASGEGALTDQDIYDAINATKPTGSIAWTQLQ